MRFKFYIRDIFDSRSISQRQVDRMENDLIVLLQKSTFSELDNLCLRETRLAEFWSNALLINNISNICLAFSTENVYVVSYIRQCLRQWGFSINN